MEEQKKKTAFQSLVTGLDSENTDATQSKQSKLKEKASISEQKAKDESELADTTSTRKEDAKYKKDLEMSWEERAAEFKSRQKLRTEELEALGKAIDIISGDAVTGSAGKHLPGLLQSGTAMAVVSVNRSLRTPSFRKVAGLTCGPSSIQCVMQAICTIIWLYGGIKLRLNPDWRDGDLSHSRH